MTEPEEEPFDFEAECIKVYRRAKDDDVKIKALALIAKVQPIRPSVKPADGPPEADPIARRAQGRMNGGA